QCPGDRLSGFVGDLAAHRQPALQDDPARGILPEVEPIAPPRQGPVGGPEARMIDGHGNLAHRGRYAVKAPLARGVGLQPRPGPHLPGLSRTFLEFNARTDVRAFDRVPRAVNDDPPHRPGRIQLGGEARRNRLGMTLGRPTRPVWPVAWNRDVNVE